MGGSGGDCRAGGRRNHDHPGREIYRNPSSKLDRSLQLYRLSSAARSGSRKSRSRFTKQLCAAPELFKWERTDAQTMAS